MAATRHSFGAPRTKPQSFSFNSASRIASNSFFFSLSTSGKAKSNPSNASTIADAITSRAYHLLSAGITYHGARLVAVFWDDYHEAYEEMVQNTATKRAPWDVIPADNKWYARLVIASAIVEALDGLDLAFSLSTSGKAKSNPSAIVEALDGLDLAFPDVDKEKKKELEAIREALLKEKD